jgi:hypothetical protein
MGVDQNSPRELGIYLKIDLTLISSNSGKNKRARQMIKIGPKFSLYPHSHFTEHLTDVFKKQPFESD